MLCFKPMFSLHVHDWSGLTVVICDFLQRYSSSLINVMTQLLNLNPEVRPTPETLREDEYVQRCIAISDSVIVDRKRRAASASSLRKIRPPFPSRTHPSFTFVQTTNIYLIVCRILYLTTINRSNHV